MPLRRPTLAGLLAVAFAASVSADVVGIDYGTEFIKVALVKPGKPLEIVINTVSKRKTDSVLSFYRGERSFGGDAAGLLSRKPEVVYARASTLLGRAADHPAAARLTGAYLQTVPRYNATRGGVDMALNDEVISPEEVVAHLFTYVADITRAFGGSDVRDAIVTVPAFFTHHERKAIVDAAEISGMKVLATIDENAAAALHYGLDRVHDEPKTVLIYNMGSNAAQASVHRYSSYAAKEMGKNKTVGMFETVGKGWDDGLGGYAFASLLVEHIADAFNEKWGKGDIRTIPRAMAKISNHAKKTKEVLSANKEHTVWAQQLHDDIDLSLRVTRTEFEGLAAGLLARVLPVAERAIADAGLTEADVDSVEIIGGSVRIPKVQEILKGFFGADRPLGVHLNGDEAPALGAAFHGANISTAFRVRKVGMVDVTPFPVKIQLSDHESEASGGLLGGLFGSSKKAEKKAAADGDDGDGDGAWGKSASLFKHNHKLDTKKTIVFAHDQDIVADVQYDPEADGGALLPEGSRLPIAVYNVTGVAKFAKEMEYKGLGTPKVSLSFLMSKSGTVELVEAKATVEEMVEVKEKPKDKKKKDKAEKKKKDKAEKKKKAAEEAEAEADAEAEAEAEGDDADADPKMETDADADADADAADAEADADAADAAEAEAEVEAEPEVKMKKKVHKAELTVVVSHDGLDYHALSEAHKTYATDRLAEIRRLDVLRHKKDALKNDLEALALSTRGKMRDLEEEVEAVSTEAQREAAMTLFQETEDWLYEDGMDAEIKAYEDKMKEVTGVAAPIFFRLAEKTARKEAVEDLRERVQKVKDMLKKWERTMPHVTEEEKGEVLDLIEGAETWVSDKLAAQAGTEAHEKPAFESKQVPGQLDRIVRMMDKLRKKEKPKPVKVENATDADNATAADADGEEAEDLDAAAEDGAGAEAEAAAGDDAAPEKDEEGSDEL